MSISKIVEKEDGKKKSSIEKCHKNSKDCMYLNKDNGTCRAEWCIFEELPDMIDPSIEITCSICGTSHKTVSVYSSERHYICDTCINKIRNLFRYWN